MAAWSDQPSGVGTPDSGWEISGHRGCATAALSSTTPADTTAGTTAGRQQAEFEAFLQSKNILHTTSPAYAKAINGVAERRIGMVPQTSRDTTCCSRAPHRRSGPTQSLTRFHRPQSRHSRQIQDTSARGHQHRLPPTCYEPSPPWLCRCRRQTGPQARQQACRLRSGWDLCRPLTGRRRKLFDLGPGTRQNRRHCRRAL